MKAVIDNTPLVSRFDHLALVKSVVISKTAHKEDELLSRGTLLGELVADGKSRAYAEGDVTTAFSAANANFAVNPAGPLAKHFRVGDVIEAVAGTALGTIATFNPETGVGTLGANSANALAIGQKVRIATSVLSIAYGKGTILQNEVRLQGNDAPVSAYFAGIFLKDFVNITAAAKASLGAVDISSTEIQLK